MKKKGKNYCIECDNNDDTRMEVLQEAPWVAECMECGHPNDNVRYDYRADRHPRGDMNTIDEDDDELMILCGAT